MRNTNQLIIGGLVILFGLIILVINLLGLNFWKVCWPVGLILLGVAILLWPRLESAGFKAKIFPLGEIRRSGDWVVSDMDIASFVSDVRLDLRTAEIPPGETVFRYYGFVGDIRLHIPQEVGYSISSTAFLTESRIQGERRDIYASNYRLRSDNYQDAASKIRLETYFFVAELRLDQS